ncbi:alpha/beta fold hydrolase [Longimicrobium terrae]|uniref:Pimeloyl-ACP methyl ester carboxylesterase n=1 Tax=Longimicrobium terrae TaxID=1639882 RepID=A0A841H488_9BACT|nr:alpha/beta hydrolase [Longimicrobium terrae]MBB4638323.1 pimeloyl-ACP methyl ester carboxylesterase [Longimicrobium terrae]MBB6072609.1 pimeloyl-ACP methyl ester carboxylesterase [Longimicrobium terrae]NNC28612.1 alpha/beta hydrolase [Longimicrobium terrae]
MPNPAAQPEPWTHHQAVVNDVRLHWVEAGDGPLVVLLHGFPEFWYGWRKQIPALAAAGFRVVAPDLRGYNLSAKPAGIRPYRVQALVDDVAALIHHLGARQAHVVGHDWGGIVAWWLAMVHPECIDRLAVLNAPHPPAFSREIRRNPKQMLASWYAGFFQLPALPEAALRARDYAALLGIFRAESVRPGAFSEDDLQRYRESASQPGALTAMLNYYRAATRYRPPPTRIIPHDTLLIWGVRDQALTIELTEGLEAWAPRLRIERIPEASHWVASEYPDPVNQLLTGFLAPPRA